MERYTVETLRSGQPRPYADSEYEYRITVERDSYQNSGKLKPWLLMGDVEKRIYEEELARKEGRLSGGESGDEMRKAQRDWAKKLVRALCRGFREKGDDDGIEEGSADAHFAATLKSLHIDYKTGTIRALVVEAYTD